MQPAIADRGYAAKCMRKMLLSYLGPDAFARHYAITMDVFARRHIKNHWQALDRVNTEGALLLILSTFNVADTDSKTISSVKDYMLFTFLLSICKNCLTFPLWVTTQCADIIVRPTRTRYSNRSSTTVSRMRVRKMMRMKVLEGNNSVENESKKDDVDESNQKEVAVEKIMT
nr:beta-amyrin 28-oxidase-like [Tanacetum cinerariifolium]